MVAVDWYACRHGHTIDNKGEIWTGQLPGKLSPEGEKFAREDLGALVQLIQPDLFLSSDLKRAIDTRDIASTSAGYRGIRYEDERLREVRFKELEGKTLREIKELMVQMGLSDFGDFQYYDTRPLLATQRRPLEERFDVEPITDIKRRISSLRRGVVQSLPPQGTKKIISIGHGLINAYFVEYELYGTCGQRIDKDGKVFYLQANSQVTIFRYDADGNLIRDKVEINIPIVDLISRLKAGQQ